MTRFGTPASAIDSGRSCAAIALLLAALFWAAAIPVPGTQAFSVSPTHIELISVGRAGRSQIVVRNTESAPLPIEVTVDKFKLDENGRRKNVSAGDDFLVFPAQALIPAGGTQVFRLQWVGEPMLAESQSYIVNISRIPVRRPKGQSGLQVAVSFGALVNVAPPKSRAQLDLVATDIVTDQSGRRLPMVTVQNPSRTHALFTHSTLRLAGEGWDMTVPPGELEQKVGIGLVQPGSRRKFVLPFPIPDKARRIRASLAFDPSRR